MFLAQGLGLDEDCRAEAYYLDEFEIWGNAKDTTLKQTIAF